MNMNESMSLTPRQVDESFPHARHSNRALIVEALVLLVFIAAAVALIIQVFAAAEVQGRDAHNLQQSTQYATAAAEAFAAAPANASGTVYYASDGTVVDAQSAAFSVITAVTADKQASGTLYHANITVYAADGSQTYAVQTERYLSRTGGGVA